MNQQGVAEGLDKQALQKELIIINKLIKDMKNSWQQQHLLQKKQELLKQLKQGVAEDSSKSAAYNRGYAAGKKSDFPSNPFGSTTSPTYKDWTKGVNAALTDKKQGVAEGNNND